MSARTIAERIASIFILAFLGLFFVLSVDSLVRLWFARTAMDSPFDAATVLLYQVAHATISLLGTLLAARVLIRAGTPGAGAFGWLLAFLTLWYTNTFGFGSYPGPFQSWLADWLFATGFPRPLAVLVFASPWWAAWLALGAALRVSVCYPRLISAADIAAPGRRDRTGLMRSVRLAGFDVGLAWRRLAAGALHLGFFRAAVVWPVTLALGLAASFMHDERLAFLALFASGFALVITNLRAGLGVSRPLARRRMLWMMHAGVTAMLAFGIAAVLSFADDRAAAVLSFAVTAIAPLAVLASVGLAALPGHPPDPREPLRNTASRGGVIVISAMAYVLTQSVATTTGGPQLLASLLGFGASVLTAALVWRRVRASASRFVAPAFARPEQSRA
jgi:hypothetical protein